MFLLFHGTGCASKDVSDNKDTAKAHVSEEQSRSEETTVEAETDEPATTTVTSENETMRVVLESSLLSDELTMTVEFPEKAEVENEDETDKGYSLGKSLGESFGMELVVSMLGMDEFSEKYTGFKYSIVNSSDSGNSIICKFTKDMQKDIIQYFKDEVEDTVKDSTRTLNYSGTEIDDGFKEIRILTNADVFDKNIMLLSDSGMMQDIMYDSFMARIYLGNIEDKIKVLLADEKTGDVLYEYNSNDLEAAQKEAMHGLDQSKDVTMEVNPDGTSTIYYYAKENHDFNDLELLANDMELDYLYENEEFSDYKYEIDKEYSIIAITCNDSVREILAQYQLSRIDDIPDRNEDFHTEDPEWSGPVYTGMEHSEDYSNINILLENNGDAELTAILYPRPAEEARRYYHYYQILKGIPASERVDPKVDYVDIYTGETVYTHEF